MGITLGEYYRQMGLNVLLIADSTSRWAAQLTGLFKNLNYTVRKAPEYAAYLAQIDELVKTLGRTSGATPDAQVGPRVSTSSSSLGGSTERPSAPG